MNGAITELLLSRPRAAITAVTTIAALAAAWAAAALGPLAAVTAALAVAVYAAGTTTAWHRSLMRKRRRQATRDAADTVAYLAADLAAGTDPTRAIAAIEPDWPREARSTTKRLAAAWSVAGELGAPAAELCRRLADDLREDERAAARTSAMTASIRATAALLTALPVAGVALGEALGVAAFASLLGTMPGIACLAAAMALQAAGIAWTRVLINGIGTETA